MIISEQGKFIFVHIQKSAGTTIKSLLKKKFPDIKHWHGRHGHAITGIEEIGREKWDEYFSFTFVRNPWDRLVSWYSMIQGQRKKLPTKKQTSMEPFNSPFWNHVILDSHDFESFIENCTNIIFENGCNKSYAFNQFDYISDKEGRIAVDFVGRFENFAEDSEKIFQVLNVNVGELPKKNPSKHNHYSNYYTQKTRDLITHRFRRDIELFKYQFEVTKDENTSGNN